MTSYEITLSDIGRARQVFTEIEPRDLFYRAALVLIGLALERTTAWAPTPEDPRSLTLTEALAVLLQTWNREYYRFHGKFDATHFEQLQNLLLSRRTVLEEYLSQTIEELDDRQEIKIVELFQVFESVLGPVGSAKALHLLAPKLFPLWDRAIATGYQLPLGRAGTNGERYWRFITISRRQCRAIRREAANYEDPLKAIDEFNYCKYTKGKL